MMENKKQKPLDMLHGPIWNKLPLFALPVAATAILEQLFNASDIAVVGNFTGAGKTIAVAAVGANSSIISLIVNRCCHCRGIGCEALAVSPSGTWGCLLGSSALS